MPREQQKHQKSSSVKPVRHLTAMEFRAITFLATLLLASIVVIMRITEPVVWGFLGTAIGVAIGHAVHR